MPEHTSEEVTVGTVVEYDPDPSRHAPRWCREGTAIAVRSLDRPLIFLDTYWGGGGDQHVLQGNELATIRPLFHLDDYDELAWSHGVRDKWLTYAPEDRQRITSQHGLQSRYFIKKGARPSLVTQIENARKRLEEAEQDARSAANAVTWRQQELADLEQRIRNGADHA
jgi:hypothetical protein